MKRNFYKKKCLFNFLYFFINLEVIMGIKQKYPVLWIRIPKFKNFLMSISHDFWFTSISESASFLKNGKHRCNRNIEMCKCPNFHSNQRKQVKKRVRFHTELVKFTFFANIRIDLEKVGYTCILFFAPLSEYFCF